MSDHLLRPIAYMRSDFPEKFGIPRQAGVVPELEGVIVFEPAYRDPEALRGIEGFSRLWLIWQFSGAVTGTFSPTVRPPRLGGNTRMGVFATRSPFRPNALGLSCVELKAVETRPGCGTVLVVRGADLMDGTPIYDIKPYVPYADCHPDAKAGFAPDPGSRLRVELPAALAARVPAEKRQALEGVLANDPRPRYQRDPDRVYALRFAGLHVRFTVADGVARVREIETEEENAARHSAERIGGNG